MTLRILCFVAAAVSSAAAVAQAPVSLELVTDGPLLGAERDWLRMTQDIPGVTVRIRGARGGDRPEVSRSGDEQRPRYRVIGVLTKPNELALPGGVRISLRDRGRLEQWIQRLQADGAEAMTEPRGPFGLTEKELNDAHVQLSRAVNFATRDLPYGPVIERLADAWTLELRWTPPARAALRDNEAERVQDDLQGLSGGVALAALLRPLGLAFALQRKPGEPPHVAIDRRNELREHWPLGWPAEEAPVTTAPKLFERITVEINKTPLSEALSALNGRIGLPVLMDHNNILLQQVDLQTRVSLPEGREFYRRIYDQLLFQAGLKMDILWDDAKRPFLWITTIKQ